MRVRDRRKDKGEVKGERLVSRIPTDAEPQEGLAFTEDEAHEMQERIRLRGADMTLHINYAGGARAIGILYLPLVIDGPPADAAREFEKALSDCETIVDNAREQFERNREEISSLGAETREILDKLKAA